MEVGKAQQRKIAAELDFQRELQQVEEAAPALGSQQETLIAEEVVEIRELIG